MLSVSQMILFASIFYLSNNSRGADRTKLVIEERKGRREEEEDEGNKCTNEKYDS